MDWSYIPAWVETIGAAATTATAAVGAWQMSKKRQVLKNEKQKKLALATVIAHAGSQIGPSEWSGFSMLKEGPLGNQGRYEVLCKLDVVEQTITGEYSYWIRKHSKQPKLENAPATLNVRGGFNDKRFLTLWLESQNPEKVHFGIMICELTDHQTKLKGIWIAFGLNAEQLISGTVLLKRKNP